MKKTVSLFLTFAFIFTAAQGFAFSKKVSEAEIFFNELKKHCGNAYEGTLATPDKDFAGKKLVMHVRKCEKNKIYIPFYVGEDKSRTWVLTLKKDRILLKHDHRHEDGTSDEVTMYGGWTSNEGNGQIQVFPADQETTKLISYAAPNVWWITLNEKIFSYNLRRMGTDRYFSVEFDVTKKLANPPAAPWGWKE
ncbi:hypothetical protein Dip510_000005 [Elusimicrobium posterum]|uniref:hypothetical protein n=1 Tax=Elusimicrobium posterum TaxID=3116653 RepID=UPI003C76CF18